MPDFDELAAGLSFEPFEPLPNGSAYRDERVRAGAVLLAKGDHYLVGHVNELLGVCDDCTDFKYRDIEAIAYLF